MNKIVVKKLKFDKRNIPLLTMFSPVILYFIIFKYIPMIGLSIAFQDYKFNLGYFNSPWVGLKHFIKIFSYSPTIDAIWNTVFLGLLTLIVSFPFPIILAIMLNDVKNISFKKTVQTVAYLPYFLSWVVVGGMVITIFSQETGVINQLVKAWFGKPYPFLTNEISWVFVYLSTGIWKETGFAAIIYLAALTNIDATLYEAASIDGASKFQQLIKITLPCLATTIVLVLILSLGQIAEVSFDRIYVLSNPTVSNLSEVISTYIYKIGLRGGNFSQTAALGFFQSVLSLLLILTANSIAKKTEQQLW